MTSRPSTAAPILAVLAVELAMLIAFAIQFWLANQLDLPAVIHVSESAPQAIGDGNSTTSAEAGGKAAIHA